MWGESLFTFSIVREGGFVKGTEGQVKDIWGKKTF